jgi:poly-gamma-glutamate system protein
MSMNRTTRLIIAGVLSLAAFWAVQILPSSAIPRNADTMIRAGQIMKQAILAIRSSREHESIGFNLKLDPNRTGLIGPEISPLMTTLGDLEAKRSTTNPNMAGFIVYLLDRAGVRPGDTIAIGSSGSFPAFLLASLSAAKAMDVRAVSILSLGASSYGATDPDFTLLDLHDLLRREGICGTPAAAVSLGGDKDVGTNYDSEIRAQLLKRIAASGVRFLNEPDLRKNVADRMQIYRGAAPRGIAAFINSGGGYANLGTSELVLDMRPGLNLNPVLPSPAERGVLFDMVVHKVPVIHLLFVKGLIMASGLPWDPIPLPEPGLLRLPGASRPVSFWLIATAYFSMLLLLAIYRR